MVGPIRAVMLATIVAWITGFITDAFMPSSSEWVLAAAACGFLGTLATLMLLGLREQ